MFSQVFSPVRIANLLSLPKPKTQEIQDILKEENLGYAKASRLLLANPADYHLILTEAISRRQKKWNGLQVIMPPLYVSDGDKRAGRCLGGCIYCPFDKGSRQITQMTTEEVINEVKVLLQMGHGDIELVSAVDRELLNASRCAEFISAAKEAGAKHVGLNFFPLKTVNDYRIMVEAGLNFTVVWQETYDRMIYGQVHPKGYKADMDFRLNAHDRAIAGGVKAVGVAFLGGINPDWRFDALSAIYHALYLSREKGAKIIFGTPRIKPAEGMDFQPAPYTDDEFSLVGAIYSLVIPDALLWWATRESREVNAQAAQGGGGLFTIVSETKVAGYTGGSGQSQFPVHRYELDEGITWLKNYGFNPVIHLPW